MTREEAIELLKSEKNRFSHKFQPYDVETREKWKGAYDMAIKSLEQESVLDKIRAEIKKEGEPCIYEIDFAYKHGLLRALEIIDKYRKGDEDE